MRGLLGLWTAERQAVSSAGPGVADVIGVARSYLEESATPLHALAFVTPMVLAHELSAAGPGVLAGQDLARTLDALGVGAYMLPLVGLVVLLAAHLASGDRWALRPGTLGVMLLESLALALPVTVLALVVGRLPLTAGASSATWSLALGAGVYEELLFRLIGVTAGMALLHDVLGVPRRMSIVVAVIVAAVAFSLYHYRGSEDFAWSTFVFRTAAGVYLGALFGLRGFGIAAGAHAAYDAIVLAMPGAGTP